MCSVSASSFSSPRRGRLASRSKPFLNHLLNYQGPGCSVASSTTPSHFGNFNKYFINLIYLRGLCVVEAAIPGLSQTDKTLGLGVAAHLAH